MAHDAGARAWRPAIRYTVNEADTAAALGSGEVPVLATPRVLALAERATVAAVAGTLQLGATTVRTRVELDRLAPSRIGAQLEVEAMLERVAGRRLQFAVRLHNGDRPVATATSPGWWWTPPRFFTTRGGQVSEL